MNLKLNLKHLLALVCVLVSSASHAAYPERPIKLVVPYTPAGVSDGLARILAEGLGRELGQNVIVENRPGANTMVAAQYVSRALPDGYTLILSSSASMVMNPLLYKSPGYAAEDFRQIAVVAEVPLIVVVNPQLGVTTLADFATQAKRQGGKWNYASVGLGNPLQLTSEHLKDLLGIELAHVPYKGSAPALMSLMSNETQMMVDVLMTSLPHVKAGKLTALAVTSENRSKLLPQVPTVAESGYPGFRATTWFGVAAPANIAPDIATMLQDALRRVVASPAVTKWADEQGLVLQPSRNDADLQAFVARDRDTWAKTIRDRNITLEAII